MLNLIYGPPGSGKTYLSDTLLVNALKDGKQVTLLVPEQEAVDTENRIYDRAISAGVSIEQLSVVSFRRLANLAFRKHGGIEYANIGDAGRLLLLWRIIEELSPALTVYKNNRDRTLIELMLSVCSEFKRYCVTPASLSVAIDSISDGRFKDKLSDVALIYTAYLSQTNTENTDSSDDINRLSQIYRENDIDTDQYFFIDSFNGFTTPELQVLDQIIKKCNTTITVNRSKVIGKTGFVTVEKTEQQLKSLAKKTGSPINVLAVLDEKNVQPENDFELIREKLFDFSYRSQPDFSSDKITFVQCKDHFSEAEYLASRVAKLVREGAKYRDIAIVSRNVSKYEGVLDAVFEKHGIPLFLSSRFKLTSTPIYKAVYSALNVITGGFDTEDILALIKCGLLGLDRNEIDEIESYVLLWNINNRRWTDDDDWFMNPDGFTDVIGERSTARLELINSIRRKIITPILTLKEDIKNQNAAAAAQALYQYIVQSGIYEYYSGSESQEDSTVFNTFIELLETLSTVIPDIPVNASVLSSLIHLMAKNTDYGMIPSTLDRVTAGDASILRCNGIKHVFLTDCESGIFPATVSDDSFFNDSEKQLLLKNGIELSPDIVEKNDLEAFYFLRSASGATNSLTATVCEKSGKTYPSIGLQRLHALFPANPTLKYPDDIPLSERISDAESARDVLSLLQGSRAYESLKSVLDELNIRYNVTNTPISEPNAVIAKDISNEIFGNNISLTTTRLETYAKCPFAYFCNYVLKIREKKHNYFEASDKGTYIHRILEKTINALFESKNAHSITETDIEQAVKTSLNEVLNSIFGNNLSAEGKRFESMMLRLNQTIVSLVENIVSEFRSSLFSPKFFEFKIGNDGLKPLKSTLDDGTQISIYGTIDRVDTYKQDSDVYVRVVDYKTGSRPHSVENIKYGLDTQMLLYLFSIWKTDSEKFKKLLGVDEGGQIIPAGVLYNPARISPVKIDDASKHTDTVKYQEQSFKRNGVLLDDERILSAMEQGLSGKFLPIKSGNDGVKAASGSVLLSIDGFGTLLNDIDSILKTIATKMKSGYACASPLKRADSCEYCSLYPICRSKQN